MKFALTQFFAPLLSDDGDGNAVSWGAAQPDQPIIFDTIAELQEKVPAYVNGQEKIGDTYDYSVEHVTFNEVYVGFMINIIGDDDESEDAYE